MRRFRLVNGVSIVLLLIALSSLSMAGCSQDSPTQPSPAKSADPSKPAGTDFTLAISGTLTPTAGVVLVSDAALLLDGSRVATRQTCDRSLIFGCKQLRLSATAGANRGVHTVDVQLLRQSCDLLPCAGVQKYDFSGTVVVSGSSGTTQEIPLARQTVRLAPGDKVTYRIDVNP